MRFYLSRISDGIRDTAAEQPAPHPRAARNPDIADDENLFGWDFPMIHKRVWTIELPPWRR
jgi:hypothetical protein